MSYIIDIKEHKEEDDKINEEEFKHFERIKKYMDECPVYEQKSKKWLENRMNYISASDAGGVLNCNSHESYYNIILKKFEQQSPFKYDYVYNGNKYETITTMLFEYLTDCRVLEYGFIPFYNGEYRKKKIDKDVSFLGCSPDGIISQYKYDWIHKTDKFGEMLEIKNPATRLINMDENADEKDVFKDIPYYYQQVQQQLYCCDFNKCHFFQLKIEEYKDRDEFIEDTDINCPYKSKKGEFKGAVIQILPIKKFKGIHLKNPDENLKQQIYANAKFIYPPKIDMTFEEITDWKKKVKNKDYIPKTNPNMPEEYNERLYNSYKIIPGYQFHKIFYWKATYGRDQIVNIDPNWLNNNYNQYKLTWDRICFVKSSTFYENLFQIICNFYKSSYSNRNKLKDMIKNNSLRPDILENIPNISVKSKMLTLTNDIIIYELDKLKQINFYPNINDDNDNNNDDNEKTPIDYIYKTLNITKQQIIDFKFYKLISSKNFNNVILFDDIDIDEEPIIFNSNYNNSNNSNNSKNTNNTNNINNNEILFNDIEIDDEPIIFNSNDK